MLEELGKDLMQVALAGVGAVTILAEKGCEIAKECAKKGAVTVEKGKVVSGELRYKAEQAAQERRERCREESLARLTKEEREALRSKLDDLDTLEAQAAAAAREADEADTGDDRTDGGE